MADAGVAHYYSNFDYEFRNYWPNSSYYCILTGMGVLPERVCPLLEHRPRAIDKAEEMFASISQRAKSLLSSLPSLDEYLTLLHGPTGHGTREEKLQRV